MIERRRILESIGAASAFPVTLLVAPAGYGKSVALDAYLRTVETPAVRFTANKQHGSLTRFVRALAAVLEPTLPGVAQSLAIAHERAIQSPKPSDVLAAWLAEHLGSEPRLVVIDDFHHCEGERSIAAFLSRAIARTRTSVRWIVACRSSADLPLATWLARGDSDLPIDAATLRLDAGEAAAIARHASLVNAAQVSALADVTGGAPAVFSFALATIVQEPAVTSRLLTGGGDPFRRFADEAFARLVPEERTLLLRTSVYADLDEGLVRAGEGDAAVRALETIEQRMPQLFRRDQGVRRYHELFGESLLSRLGESGIEAARDARFAAASALECCGRLAEAIGTHTRERHDAELVRLVEAHGFTFVDSGRGDVIQEAIEALDPITQTGSAAALAIKAIAESRLGRFDTAEAWFQLAVDRAAAVLRPTITYHYGNHLVRFLRREAVDVLGGLAEEEGVPDRLRAYAYAALGPAHVFEHRIAQAQDAAGRALAIARTAGDVHLLAKVHHQAAYVAMFAGDAERAKELAGISLGVAEEHGFYDVAAGALTVLNGVAGDIEDDPAESLRLLEAVGDCAAKSGCLLDAQDALVAIFEIEVERGNDDAAERVDDKLRALDIACAGRVLYEALLPTRALRAAWSGDFEGGYRLLASTEERPFSADRKALRHAEVAFYAAAARLDEAASTSIRATLHALDGLDRIELRAQRARLVAALAMIVLGRSEQAAEMLARVDEVPEALSRRLLALRRTAGALLQRYRGARNQNDILSHLTELRDCGFGGVARALAMLPLADNAQRRVALLSDSERVAMVRWADGEGTPLDDQLHAIVEKLGCNRNGAALRAVIRHRASFELAEMPQAARLL